VDPLGQPAGGDGGSGTQRAKEATGAAAGRVAETVKHEASHLSRDVADQAQRVVGDTRQKVMDRADGQREQWSHRLGDAAKSLRGMADGGGDDDLSRTMVNQLATRTGVLADYLASHRVKDVVAEVEGFARRRPGVFLLGLAAAGFVAGRLGKSVAMAQHGDGGSGGSPSGRVMSTPPPAGGTYGVGAERVVWDGDRR